LLLDDALFKRNNGKLSKIYGKNKDSNYKEKYLDQ
jgi:hypothetical protein